MIKKEDTSFKEKEQISNFFKKKVNKGEQADWPEPEVMEVPSDYQGCSVTQTTIPSSFQDGGKLNAEIRWCLKHVLSGYSDISDVDSCELFEVMFPDSKIASQMELGRMKLKYNFNFGLGPHFRDILRCKSAASEWYSISFDESLNKVLMKVWIKLCRNVRWTFSVDFGIIYQIQYKFDFGTAYSLDTALPQT